MKITNPELFEACEILLTSNKPCPFEENEDNWRDEEGRWNCPDWCSVSFSSDYYGEVESYCDGCTKQPDNCWYHYLMGEFGEQ